jgi:membrane protease YdiL (CAAX protease family)
MGYIPPNDLPLWVIGAVLVAFAVRIYGRLVVQLLTGGGQVRTEAFDLADLLVVTVLSSWFWALALKGFITVAPQTPFTLESILESIIMFSLLVGLIVFVLHQRHGSITHLFGLRCLSLNKVLSGAFHLLLAAYPLVSVSQYLTHLWRGRQAETQEIVQFFQYSAEHGLYWNVLAAGARGVLIAPLAEEFIFRGYIYGVLRRNLGIVPSILFTSLLFASIHLSFSALPALLLFGICLSLAYEHTGSLWVPILMHSGFNLLNFVAMLAAAKMP